MRICAVQPSNMPSAFLNTFGTAPSVPGPLSFAPPPPLIPPMPPLPLTFRTLRELLTVCKGSCDCLFIIVHIFASARCSAIERLCVANCLTNVLDGSTARQLNIEDRMVAAFYSFACSRRATESLGLAAQSSLSRLRFCC